MCVFLELIYKNGIGTLLASVIGACTLIIAHHLANTSDNGDTLELMRAVLDTNFWLATHVVVVTLGYAATFLAGFLAITYIFVGSFTNLLRTDGGKTLYRMVYGILCFALLFSFVGTILGGILGLDQSLGPFLGLVTPKENGRKGLNRPLERRDFARQMGRFSESPRHDEHGGLRKRRHQLVLVRHQHARRRTAQLRLHGKIRPRFSRLRSRNAPHHLPRLPPTNGCGVASLSPNLRGPEESTPIPNFLCHLQVTKRPRENLFPGP